MVMELSKVHGNSKMKGCIVLFPKIAARLTRTGVDRHRMWFLVQFGSASGGTRCSAPLASLHCTAVLFSPTIIEPTSIHHSSNYHRLLIIVQR